MHENPRIVIVGGGLAGLEAALYAHERLGSDAGITLIAAEKEFVFRPFLTYVPFGLRPETTRLDLASILAANGIELLTGRVDEVKPRKKLVHFGAQSVAYDYLVVATGAVSVRESVEGLRRGHAVWEEADMLRLRDTLARVTARAEGGKRLRVLFLVPPGCAWSGPLYELALMTAAWLRRKGVREQFDLRLCTAEGTFVEALGPSIHDTIAAELAERDILAEAGRLAARVETGRVTFDDGGEAPFDVLVNAAVHRGAGPRKGLETDAQGFYRTRLATRQSVTSDDVYAVGDGSDYPVKQGFLGLLQADAAAEHIAARVLGQTPEFVFEPASLWMMDEFSGTLLAHGTATTADSTVALDHTSGSRLRRVEVIGHLPQHSRLGHPLYAGLLWKGTEVGLHVLAQLSEADSDENRC